MMAAPVVGSWPFRLVVLLAILIASVADFRRRIVPLAVSIPLLALGAGRCLAAGNLPAVAALGLALWNVRKGEPWTHALILAAGAAEAAWTAQAEPILLPALILAVYRMWRARWIGGGDGKLMMALFCLYPDLAAVLSVAGGWFVLGLLALAWRYRRSFVQAAALSAVGQLPPAGSLDETGVPSAIGIALGFGLYLLYLLVRGNG